MISNTHENPVIALFVAALLCLNGCEYTTKTAELVAEPEVISSLHRYTREYTLVPGDALEIAVYRNGDVSRTVIIRPDGNFSLPLLDDVEAAGLTIGQLDDLLTERLSTRLVNPEVTIIVVNPPEPMVYVYGDVRAVQPVPLRQARTLAQAIAFAGGLTRDAAIHNVALIRLEEDGHLRLHRLNKTMRGQEAAILSYHNTALRPDDVIVVPESLRSQAGRFITDFITEPLSAVNMILTPYFQFRLISEIEN